MKRFLYILLLMIGGMQSIFAQNEVEKNVELVGVKNFGGFILDMGKMLNTESITMPLQLPTLGYLAPFNDTNYYKFNLEAFKRKTDFINLSAPSFVQPYNLFSPFDINMINWQGRSYKLSNGVRINMYGEYDENGYKRYNPASVFPWERKNFNAAFEMKTENGNFGIKVEVSGGRNNQY